MENNNSFFPLISQTNLQLNLSCDPRIKLLQKAKKRYLKLVYCFLFQMLPNFFFIHIGDQNPNCDPNEGHLVPLYIYVLNFPIPPSLKTATL